MMKQHIYWLFFILLLTGCNNKKSTGSYDEIISIPDSTFKFYLVANFDINGDGEISKSEAGAVEHIDVFSYISRNKDEDRDTIFIDPFKGYKKRNKDETGNGIVTLEGIQHFTSLITLHCGHNKLKTLDISKNKDLEFIDCRNNQIEKLDVSKNRKLRYLDCAYNKLTGLDVRKNKSLKSLSCEGNKLKQLDIRKNRKLEDLDCQFNELTLLNVKNNRNLISLFCSGNRIAALNLKNNIHLTYLGCHHNQLTSLNVNKNGELASLYCENNKLVSLDISGNKLIRFLHCHHNQLEYLNLGENGDLHILFCGNNQLNDIDLKNNKELAVLYCENNQLTNLNIRNNTELQEIFYTGNPVAKLDISHNTNLHIIEDYMETMMYEPENEPEDIDEKPVILKISDKEKARDQRIQKQVLDVLNRRIHYIGRNSHLVQQTEEGVFCVTFPEVTNRESFEYMLTENPDIKIYKAYDFKEFHKKIEAINYHLINNDSSFVRRIDSVIIESGIKMSSHIKESKAYPLGMIFSYKISAGFDQLFVVGAVKQEYMPIVEQCFNLPDIKRLFPSDVLLKWDEYLSVGSFYPFYALQIKKNGKAYLDGKNITGGEAYYFDSKTEIKIEFDEYGCKKLKQLMGEWIVMVAHDRVIATALIDNHINNGFLIIKDNNLTRKYNSEIAKDILMKMKCEIIDLPVTLQIENRTNLNN